MLSLLAELLDKGSPLYHRPVLRLLFEYTRLQDSNSHEMMRMAGTIMTVATQHVKVGGAIGVRKSVQDLIALKF